MSKGRIVVAKVGLDGHDVGIMLVARALVDAGFEVIYLGKRVPTDTIVNAAISEDADAVAVSGLSGGLSYFAIRTCEGLRGTGIPVIAGGIDEPDEIERMLAAGVYRHFGPGADMPEVVASFREAIESRAAYGDRHDTTVRPAEAP